jgi:hypothetical protein
MMQSSGSPVVLPQQGGSVPIVTDMVAALHSMIARIMTTSVQEVTIDELRMHRYF